MHRPIALVLFLVAAVALAAPPTPKPQPPAPADLNAPPADAVKTDTGLITKQLSPGSGGEQPRDTDFVHMRYTVWKAPEGTAVVAQEAPAFVDLQKILPGLRETLLLMTPGEKRRSWLSPSLGAGKIPEGKVFVVDAELVDIVHAPVAPADVAAPPADATVTRSGLAYKILKPGSGSVHPKKRDTVIVHYSGWTTNGKLFDTSVLRDEPAEFPVTAVIPGWTEGLQLMVEGEKARFWIPSKLAYDNDPEKPLGMLVFDVELVKIK